MFHEVRPDPAPVGTQDPETPPGLSSSGWVLPWLTREQPAGEVGGLRPRAAGLPGVYSEEVAVSDLHEEAWAGGTSVTRCVLPLLSTQGKPSCHGEQGGHSRVPWEGPWTQPWGHSPVEVTSR